MPAPFRSFRVARLLPMSWNSSLRHRPLPLVAATASALVLVGGCATTTMTSNAPIAAPDRQFTAFAATAGENEIAASRAALQKGTSPAVRTFAQQMITDHTMANDQLKAILSAKSVVATAGPDAEHVAAVAKMSSLSGTDFDNAYLQQMVVDHQKTVAMFDAETRNGADADITNFAATTLPTLRGHLAMAQQLANGSGLR